MLCKSTGCKYFLCCFYVYLIKNLGDRCGKHWTKGHAQGQLQNSNLASLIGSSGIFSMSMDPNKYLLS